MSFSLHGHERPGTARHASTRSTGSGVGVLFAIVLAAMLLMIALSHVSDLRAVIEAPALNAERTAPVPAPEHVRVDRRGPSSRP